MKLAPVSKNDDFNLFNNDEVFDNWLDYPYSKFGKNMQKMKTDVLETKDQYIINVDIPGYDKNDIKIHVGDNYLTVYVKKEEVEEEKSKQPGKYIYRERYIGTCSRSFYIGNIREENVKAKYDNGTLTLTMPKQTKPEKETKHWINIE